MGTANAYIKNITLSAFFCKSEIARKYNFVSFII